MGTFTPNIGLYIPAAGETNYSDAFAAGMMNLDSHDHSGGPNKGLPISTTGLGDHSVTYEKLAANVADITTGIGVNNATGFQYQLQMLGVLRNLFTFASTGGGTGIIAVNGSTVYGRTLQNSLDGSITWTYPDGVGGNPIPAFNIGGISPVTVPNGGTGVTSFNAWDIICGGTTGTGPLQQVSGEGTAGQSLVSKGPNMLPVWNTNFNEATRPAFSAIRTSNTTGVTGNGAFYRIAFQAENFDQASNFVTGASSAFTAPYAGIFWFNINLYILNTSSNVNTLGCYFVVNNTPSAVNLPIYLNPDNVDDSTGNLFLSGGMLLKLNMNDTVWPSVVATGGSDNTKVLILAGTNFSGYQVA